MHVYSQGVNFITPEGEITLHGTLVTVSADNLGSHCIGGFKGSCTALRPCRHCMISYNEMRDKVIIELMIICTKLNIRTLLSECGHNY